MSNQQVFSRDKSTPGIYRALVLKKVEEKFLVYIPALHRSQKPFIDMENPALGLRSGDFDESWEMKIEEYPKAVMCCWQVVTELQTGDAIWLMFENGDINFPVIMGQFTYFRDSGKINYDITSPAMSKLTIGSAEYYGGVNFTAGAGDGSSIVASASVEAIYNLLIAGCYRL